MTFVLNIHGFGNGSGLHRKCCARPPSLVMTLTSKERAELRSIAGRKEMVKELITMFINEDGPPEDFSMRLDKELASHEIVKLKMKVKKKKEAKTIAEVLVGGVNAEIVQVTGHTVVVYRERKNSPGIVLKCRTPDPESNASN
ncbi:hypothetical protein NDN08_007741 [Rhodosorus marinus]|uniref:CRM domain-containing protein n=1 Tax=Rhodosorus marinus TaxID=101924 RepID=A0AAV8V3V4_9RHOD|nr:hypothetical protein NDN08_007741 [Rhodosorus marinus]